MLKPLDETDLLSFPPDIDGIDLFTPAFDWKVISTSPGCYAFYEEATGEVVYIGSAGADGVNPKERGLRRRLHEHRGYPLKALSKVRTAHQTTPLLLKCWISQSPGDCRKYESDALRKYTPRLNVMGILNRTETERQQERKSRLKRYYETRCQTPLIFDPTVQVFCPGCGETKKRGDFGPNKLKKNGLKTLCRVCVCNKRSEKTGRPTRAAKKAHPTDLTEKRCYHCNQIKSIDCFGEDKNGVGGFKNHCRQCVSIFNKIQREKQKTLK